MRVKVETPGVGDPCKEAVKAGSAAGSYRMPAGNPYMGSVLGDYSGWVAVGGINGRWYKEGASNQFFYPAAGWRRYNGGLLSSQNIDALFWSSTPVPERNNLSYYLHINENNGINVSSIVDVIHAFAIRCIK